MLTRYTNVKVKVLEDQRAKITNAIHSEADSVTIRLKPENFTGDDILAFTQTQLNKLRKAYESNKGATIKMSKTQIKHNLNVIGGFLPLLAGIAAKALLTLTGTVLPALATGALSGLASTGVNKIIGAEKGKKIYLKKQGFVYTMLPRGEGLYLKPYRGKGLHKQGEGLR